MPDFRINNINVFLDTEKMCKTNKKLIDAIMQSNSKQYIVYEDDVLELKKDINDNNIKSDKEAKIIVSKKRSFEAAKTYAYEGMKVCVHNFASSTNPGGGVENGSNAQEESLCRCSTLYFNISEPQVKKSFHYMHKSMLKNGIMDATYNGDCIYTPGVVVFKDDTNMTNAMPEEKWYNVNVITCAAPNLRPKPSNMMNPGSGSKQIKLKDKELLDIHMKRVSRILDIAKKEGNDVVILGAFGCGAFQNSPMIVAEAMARIVKLYKNDFSVIEFAVYCRDKETENYDIFNRRLSRI